MVIGTQQQRIGTTLKRALIPVIAAAAVAACSLPANGQEVQTPPSTRWGASVGATYDTGLGPYFGLGPRYEISDCLSFDSELVFSTGVFDSKQETEPQGIIISPTKPESLLGLVTTGETNLRPAADAGVQLLDSFLNQYGLGLKLDTGILTNLGLQAHLGLLIANWGSATEIMLPYGFGVRYFFGPLNFELDYWRLGSDVLGKIGSDESLSLSLKWKF